MKGNGQKLSFDVYGGNFEIIEVLLGFEKERFLDLDDMKNYSRISEYSKRIGNILKNSNFYKDAKNKGAAVINFMQENGDLEDIDIIKKTFSQKIPWTLHKIEICREMLCIKNPNVIKEITISEQINKAEFDAILISCFDGFEYI